jgi:predicted nucleic acid-binding Zn ribbon protein
MNSEIINRQCKNCSRPVKGRSDKQFCTETCRNSFNNERNQQDNNFTRNISSILKRNRSKLRELFSKKLKLVDKAELDASGFNWHFHTHCKEDKKGSAITYCFDYGIQLKPDNKVKIIYQSQF